MTLKRDDFDAFFRALHDDHAPFSWQRRLLDELLETGRWPARIVAPTGAGKTAAIDVHIFAVALTADRDQARPPRRLAMVVGRRVLVDDQYEHAKAVDDALRRAGGGVLAEVATRLRRLRWPEGHPALHDAGTSPLVVARLRGGAVPTRDWRDEPTACAVLCATPDMWGSRLLFHGYGTAPRARPREAGLLAVDAAVVVDEAHLSRQLLTTARRVAQLVPVADDPLPVPSLQVVETTATPAGGSATGGSVGVAPEDLAGEPLLRARLTRPKPLRLVSTRDWPATTPVARRRVAALLADEVTSVLAETRPDQPAVHTVGCYVNTVGMAVEVARVLRTRERGDGTPLRVVLVCGQVRPVDLDRLRREHPGVLGAAGNRTVDVIVTTQSLEVGVDIDLAGVVTELAPASALVQRAGRVNRRGLRADGPVRVVVPPAKPTGRSRSGPYHGEELAEALDWLRPRAAEPDGLAPLRLQDDPPPQAGRRRMLYQRPELGDVWHWARTSDELAAWPEFDLWLAESFEADASVGVAVRDAMPTDAGDAIELIRLIPPRDDELFTVPSTTATWVAAQAGDIGADESKRPAVVRIRGEEFSVIDPRQADLRPGDILVVDSRTVAFTPSTVGTGDGFSPPAPADGAEDSTTVGDMLHYPPDTGPGRVVLRLEAAAWPATAGVAELLKEYAEVSEEAAGARQTHLRRLLPRLVADLGDDPRVPLVTAAIKLLAGQVKDSDVYLHRDELGEPVRIVLVDRRRASAEERTRQIWLSAAAGPVLLDAHRTAVADRAAWMGRQAHLPVALVDCLRLAGYHHDDGKADRRFQAGLRAGLDATGDLLAKSGGRSYAEFREAAKKAGLPERWRHEQRSVVASWKALHAALPPEIAPLAARLVGTSHGWGRHGFPHTAAELLASDDSNVDSQLAGDLFDAGGWDELIEATHHRWGVWGCAYLEALLRAADGNVSGEGT